MLIKQVCRGNSRSSEFTLNSADMASLLTIMAGVVTVYDEKSSGGTDIATPASLRHVKLGVNRKLDRLSCTVNIKHLKPTKSLNDVFAQKSLFDANFTSSLAATGIRAIYEGSK